jgi:hypothetical protein
MSDATDTSSQNVTPRAIRKSKERVCSTAKKHWLGAGANHEQKAIIDEIRRQYFVTADEYYKAAIYIYDSLGVQNQKLVAHKAPFALPNRNVQLFIAYSILWEAFDHIYTAAAYTNFANDGSERAELEDERTKITRVLNSPILTDQDFAKITILKNGETVNAAINRMVDRSSRELKEIYGVDYDQTLTNMDAFSQGVVEITETQKADCSWQREGQRETWAVKALDSNNLPIDPKSEFSYEKYRSVIKWHCYQIRHNLNFVGKSDGSIDDAILIIRAFCLLEPLIGLLLQHNKKTAIFAL